MANVEEFCSCPDWEPCGCGNQQDGRHCMYCVQLLSPEQLAAFDFDTDEHIPPRPRGLPIQISCGACNVTIDNPTQEQIDFHFNDEHCGLNQPRRSAVWEPPKEEMNEHRCQWDMSTFPSDGYLLEFNVVMCCGAPAPVKLDDTEFEIWSCVEHHSYYQERPI